MTKRITEALWGARNKPWAPALAFLLIALFAGYAIQQSSQRDAELLREGLISACERANVRDQNANQRTDIMAEVLEVAAQGYARRAEIADDAAAASSLRQVASRYRELIADLPYAEPLDCEEAIPSP